MVMIMDFFHDTINTNKKKILTRLLICIVFFLLGLCMTTKVSKLKNFCIKNDKFSLLREAFLYLI
jgi:hypothetical protein